MLCLVQLSPRPVAAAGDAACRPASRRAQPLAPPIPPLCQVARLAQSSHQTFRLSPFVFSVYASDAGPAPLAHNPTPCATPPPLHTPSTTMLAQSCFNSDDAYGHFDFDIAGKHVLVLIGRRIREVPRFG